MELWLIFQIENFTMLRAYSDVDDSLEATDVFVQTFGLIGNVFKKLYKKLLKFVVKKAVHHMHVGLQWMITEWLVSHNTGLMLGHIMTTWSLVAYRAFRRYSWKSSCKSDGPRSGGGDCTPTSNVPSVSDAEETIISTEDFSFIDDLDASCSHYGKYKGKKELKALEWTGSECSTSVVSTSVSRGVSEGAGSYGKSKCASNSDQKVKKEWPSHDTSSENIIHKLQEAAKEGLNIEEIIELENKTVPFIPDEEDEEEYFSNILDQNDSGHRQTIFAEQFNPEEAQDWKAPVYAKSAEQRAKLVMAVKDNLLFRQLDSMQMRELMDAMSLKHVNKGEVIIKEGDDGDFFYIIDRGTFEAFKMVNGQDLSVRRYDGVGSFGELALMYNMPRAATVKAVTDGSLWALDRQTFRTLVVKANHEMRKKYLELITHVTILKDLKDSERLSLVDALVPMCFKNGAKIIGQGDVANGMYFVVEGQVRITVTDEMDNDIELKVLKSGDYFGELALLTNKTRAASAYAVGFVKVAFLDKGGFERLLGPCLHIMQRNISNYEEERSQQIKKS